MCFVVVDRFFVILVSVVCLCGSFFRLFLLCWMFCCLNGELFYLNIVFFMIVDDEFDI